MSETTVSPRKGMTPEGALAFCEERRIDTLIVAGPDTHGIMRGKRLPARQIRSALRDGVHFCDVFYVVDLGEPELVAKPESVTTYFPTDRNGYPDIRAVPDLRTLREVPWHERTALVLADFELPSGDPVPIDPRRVLAQLVERYRELGLEPQLGLELEFYVLRENEETLRRKRAAEIEPLSQRPAMYGVEKGSEQEPFTRAIREAMERFGVPLEACSPETGPSQFEINLRHAPALDAADHAFLFKWAVREIAKQQDLTATFTAKPHPEWAGNSCHVHISVLDRNGNNAFAGERPGERSRLMDSACAGILVRRAHRAERAHGQLLPAPAPRLVGGDERDLGDRQSLSWRARGGWRAGRDAPGAPPGRGRCEPLSRRRGDAGRGATWNRARAEPARAAQRLRLRPPAERGRGRARDARRGRARAGAQRDRARVPGRGLRRPLRRDEARRGRRLRPRGHRLGARALRALALSSACAPSRRPRAHAG